MSKFSKWFKNNISSAGVYKVPEAQAAPDPESTPLTVLEEYAADTLEFAHNNPNLEAPVSITSKRCGALVVIDEEPRNLLLCTLRPGHSGHHWDGTPGEDRVAADRCFPVTDVAFMKPREAYPEDYVLVSVKLGNLGHDVPAYETTIAILTDTPTTKEF